MIRRARGTGFIGGFVTPTRLDGAARRSWELALAVDLGLLTLFVLQHSSMARPAFRHWWARMVPRWAERSSYVLASSLVVAALFVYWEPLGGVVWQATSVPLRTVIITWYVCGWLLLLYATLLIDHLDLFGQKQIWCHFSGKAYRAPPLNTPTLHQVVREPLYIGWLTVFWAAPTMTIAHLFLALTTTAYILIAIRLEERDVIGGCGDLYIEYRERMQVPIARWSAPPAGGVARSATAGWSGVPIVTLELTRSMTATSTSSRSSKPSEP